MPLKLLTHSKKSSNFNLWNAFFFYAAQSHFVSHNTDNYNLSINGRLCCQPASFPHTVWQSDTVSETEQFPFFWCGINHSSSWIMHERKQVLKKKKKIKYIIQSKQHRYLKKAEYPNTQPYRRLEENFFCEKFANASLLPWFQHWSLTKGGCVVFQDEYSLTNTTSSFFVMFSWNILINQSPSA